MRLKRWEAGIGTIGVLFALLYLVSNVSMIGWGLLCADAIWLLTRIEVVEKPGAAPGRRTRLKGNLGLAKLLLIGAIYVAIIFGGEVIRHDHASRTRVGTIAAFALYGLAFMLLAELKRSADDTVNWIVGYRAEHKVGQSLEVFKSRGWLILHGYKRDYGDIDHIVCGSHGGYVVETKSRGFRTRDLGQVRGNAWWLREKLGVQWITGVLCVDGPHAPEHRDKVWVMGHDELIPWLEKNRDTAVDPERARQILHTLQETTEKRRGVRLNVRAVLGLNTGPTGDE